MTYLRGVEIQRGDASPRFLRRREGVKDVSGTLEGSVGTSILGQGHMPPLLPGFIGLCSEEKLRQELFGSLSKTPSSVKKIMRLLKSSRSIH